MNTIFLCKIGSHTTISEESFYFQTLNFKNVHKYKIHNLNIKHIYVSHQQKKTCLKRNNSNLVYYNILNLLINH